MKTISSFFIVLLISFFTSFSSAQIPQTLSYQGLLTDPTGSPVANASYNITFNFYTVATAGTVVQSRTINGINTFQGLFTTIIGNGQGGSSNTPLNNLTPPLGSTQYYIGLQVNNGTELSPRVALTAVPYAFAASTLDAAAIVAGSQVGTGINASNITTGTLNGALVGTGITAANINGTLPGAQVGTGIIATNITTGTVANTLLDANLQDLADGSLTGSKVGTGISATNITTGTIANTLLDANLQDLADGSLTGSKIGTGISAANITTGSLNGSLVGGGVNAANVTTGKLGLAQLPASLDLTTTASSLILTPGTNATRPPTAAVGAIRFNTDATVNMLEFWNGTNWFYVVPKVAFVRQLESSNTNAGGSASGTWNTRSLTDWDGDPNVLTLNTGTNQFSLTAGDYIIEASAQAIISTGHRIALVNASNASDAYYGTSESEYPSAATYNSTRSFLSIKLPVTSTTSYKLMHFIVSGYPTDGFGGSVGAPQADLTTPGPKENYTLIKITKLR